ncbi:SgcJ/EcaC family oxidoreductase [Salipiger mucosus]|uniref:DUF4440 domain-containing protein n=1 Tax=Salipiger mucosus DSM 16094 TaxID=1123237 RepID=S9QKL7_9RHOB|nr:SgcJ/EcaC family oxidoreductase [Salipiger mucosus]EPX81996.1 hypothetical protein Salmuc_02360 [Salipiger mucosus DSM 16094]
MSDPRLPSDPGDFPAAFARAWASREGAEIAALFTEDADFVNVTGLWWHGRAAIAAPHDYALKSFFSETSLRIGRCEVRMLGPDHALVRARIHLKGQRTPDGGTADPRQTIFLFVLQRDVSGWRAVSAQNTEVSPGKETHLSEGGGHRAVDYRAE